MGSVASVQQGRDRRWEILFAAGLLAGLVLRVILARASQTPGHGDSAFYYTVATNIVDGRGLVVDYVTYFFNGLVPITHYAGDFWNPLAEILLSAPMLIFGKSVFHAMFASFAAGLVTSLVAFFAARRYFGSASLAALAGILAFFAPFEVWFSTTTEAIIFFGAFGALALYFCVKGRTAPRYFLIAALCTGLAHLVRQDGILLLATLMGCIALAPLSWRHKAGIAAIAASIHLLVYAPVPIRNYAEFGTPFPSGPAQTAFLTTYEDFHSYGKRLDWGTLRATWGILGIARRRLHTAVENLRQLNYFTDRVLAFLILLGSANLLWRRRGTREIAVFLPVLLFSVLEYLFYTVIASFSGPGSLPKGLAVALPFLCIICVDFFECYIRPKAVLTAAILVLAIYCGYRGYMGNYNSNVYYNGVYGDYATVRGLVEKDAAASGIPSDDIVVMGRNTWDIYAGTGFKAVMVPNNDLETIYEVAEHYSARYILLPAPREALDDIYWNTTPDPRFKLVSDVPGTDWKIFRIYFPGN